VFERAAIVSRKREVSRGPRRLQCIDFRRESGEGARWGGAHRPMGLRTRALGVPASLVVGNLCTAGA
jgi:hypothetical protein